MIIKKGIDFAHLVVNLEDTLKSLYGITFPWWVFSLIVWAGLGAITYIGVKPAIRTSILLSVVEVAITVALSLTIFAKDGVTSHDLTAGFTLQQVPYSPAPKGLFLALVFSVLSYTGFEATAPLAEETKDPKRNVAIGAVLGVVLILVYYVIFGFATSVGFGVDKMATGFTATSNPYYVIANSVWGKAGETRLGAGVAGALYNDEFVVYAPAQQTLRYLVTFDR